MSSRIYNKGPSYHLKAVTRSEKHTENRATLELECSAVIVRVGSDLAGPVGGDRLQHRQHCRAADSEAEKDKTTATRVFR